MLRNQIASEFYFIFRDELDVFIANIWDGDLRNGELYSSMRSCDLDYLFWVRPTEMRTHRDTK